MTLEQAIPPQIRQRVLNERKKAGEACEQVYSVLPLGVKQARLLVKSP